MVQVLVQDVPLGALQKELRKKRVNAKSGGKGFQVSTEDHKQAVKDLRCQLKCSNKNLAALWFASKGMVWAKGAVQGKKNTLSDVMWADLLGDKDYIDDVNWVAYKVRRYCPPTSQFKCALHKN